MMRIDHDEWTYQKRQSRRELSGLGMTHADSSLFFVCIHSRIKGAHRQIEK